MASTIALEWRQRRRRWRQPVQTWRPGCLLQRKRRMLRIESAPPTKALPPSCRSVPVGPCRDLSRGARDIRREGQRRSDTSQDLRASLCAHGVFVRIMSREMVKYY